MEATPNPSVVVPAVGAASSTTVLRSLGRRGIHTIAVSEQESPPASASKYCDETEHVPDPSEHLEAYRDALLSFAKWDVVRAIVPMREPDVYTLAKYRSQFAEHVSPRWPSLETLTAV